MVCLGFKPRAAEWKAQTNPLSYGVIPRQHFLRHSIETKMKREKQVLLKAESSLVGTFSIIT